MIFNMLLAHWACFFSISWYDQGDPGGSGEDRCPPQVVGARVAHQCAMGFSPSAGGQAAVAACVGP